MSRRQFMGLVAASVAAEAAGCRRAVQEPIVPYVRLQEGVSPGAVTEYATSMMLDGYAHGLLVQCRDGRPLKIEGNPDHPASLGATGPMEQASVLQLYDPDRARDLTLRGGPASWTGLQRLLAGLREQRGEGLRLLMPPTTSPFLVELMGQVHRVCSAARFAFYAPLSSESPRAGAALAFGRPVETLYDLSAADVIVSLDADVLAQGPFWLRYANQFARRRDPDAGVMSRLYCAEAMFSVTGSMADHRLPVASGQISRVTLQLAAALTELASEVVPGPLASVVSAWHGRQDPWIQAAARDLANARGRGLVLAGERQPAEVHALAQALNHGLGNHRRTTWTIPSALIQPDHAMGLQELAGEMRAGKVSTLVILEGNPSYDAPADLGFDELLRKVPTTVYLAPYRNETAQGVQWFVPAAHYLESWGDARAFDGTLSLTQPLIATMHDERTPAHLLSALAEPTPRNLRQLLGESLGRRGIRWQDALRDGMVRGTASAPVDVSLDADAVAVAAARLRPKDSLELNLLPDPGFHDGRFANNGWLLEFPRPITTLCWGNAALLSPATAQSLGVKAEDVLELEVSGRSLKVPAFVLAGHADGAVSLHLGYGREGGEHLARHVGANAYVLRPGNAYFMPGLTVRRTGEQRQLTLRQLHHEMHDREIAIRRDLDWYRQFPGYFDKLKKTEPTLMKAHSYEGDQWAMSIDLGHCIGCGACVVACQAENNVPVVGAEQTRLGRAMHWLRIDHYADNQASGKARVVHQPMACQHCEDAPCEYVCPVNATVHSDDGLNEMVYNRCVGTRFCSNNCPYKVRRFNWFNWYEHEGANQGLVRLQRNPEVTVRDRGVMEKCTYCVQRIRNAQIGARLEDRELRAGEVRTACQQACPTQAIAFGSLREKDQPVVKRREKSRAYELLHDQGTRPRTWYLARIDNPNPDLESK